MQRATETLTITAGCKVNLYLDITGVKDNGYHELDSLFYPLPEPCDTLTVTIGEGSGLRLSCSQADLSGDDNTIARAYARFAEKTGFAPAMSVHLEKRIPTGAGLGGGSADAAALLRLMNKRAGESALTDEALIALAAGVGADVPFFIKGQPALASGIGEKLKPVALDLKGFTLLLLCPDIHVSTIWAYKAWDELNLPVKEREKHHECLTCDTSAGKCFPCSAFLLRNSFECAVFGKYPKLRIMKERLLREGASGAVMSGSGSTLCALFRSRTHAERVAEGFRGEPANAYLHSF